MPDNNNVVDLKGYCYGHAVLIVQLFALLLLCSAAHHDHAISFDNLSWLAMRCNLALLCVARILRVDVCMACSSSIVGLQFQNSNNSMAV